MTTPDDATADPQDQGSRPWQDPDLEPWEYAAERRREFWDQYGRPDDTAVFGYTNGPTSRWPGFAENFVPVWGPDRTFVTTDGLSSPWAEEGGDPGEGVELYVDFPRTDLTGTQDLLGTLELEAIMKVADRIAGEHYRFTFDYYGGIVMRMPPGDYEVPSSYLDAGGNLCLLMGASARVRPDYIEMFDNPLAVRLIAITPIHGVEAEWASRTKRYQDLCQVVSGSPQTNQFRFDRICAIEQLELLDE